MLACDETTIPAWLTCVQPENQDLLTMPLPGHSTWHGVSGRLVAAVAQKPVIVEGSRLAVCAARTALLAARPRGGKQFLVAGRAHVRVVQLVQDAAAVLAAWADLMAVAPTAVPVVTRRMSLGKARARRPISR